MQQGTHQLPGGTESGKAHLCRTTEASGNARVTNCLCYWGLKMKWGSKGKHRLTEYKTKWKPLWATVLPQGDVNNRTACFCSDLPGELKRPHLSPRYHIRTQKSCPKAGTPKVIGEIGSQIEDHQVACSFRMVTTSSLVISVNLWNDPESSIVLEINIFQAAILLRSDANSSIITLP